MNNLDNIAAQEPVPVSNKKQGRNLLLDCIKGICILLVVITHLPWQSEQRLALLFSYWIDMAVPVFMILSGYLTAKSMEKSGLQAFPECYEKKRLLKSILRLTIPYLMAYVLEMVLYVYRLRTAG